MELAMHWTGCKKRAQRAESTGAGANSAHPSLFFYVQEQNGTHVAWSNSAKISEPPNSASGRAVLFLPGGWLVTSPKVAQ